MGKHPLMLSPGHQGLVHGGSSEAPGFV